MTESDPVILAKSKLEEVTEGLPWINVKSYGYIHGWQSRRRAEEISLYGTEAAVDLIPPIKIVHGVILNTLLDGQIHTKESLAKPSDEDIERLFNTKDKGYKPKSELIVEAMRDLAAAELAQRNGNKW